MARIVGVETLHRGRRAGARAHRGRARGLGPGGAVPRRYHRADPAPSGRPARSGPGPRRTSSPRLGERGDGARAQVPRLHLVRALGRRRHRAVGPAGQAAGGRVCELIGGSLRPLPVYASSMRRDIRPEDEAARLAGLRDRARLSRVQVPHRPRSAGTTRTSGRAAPRRSSPRCDASWATDVALLVDANSCYSPGQGDRGRPDAAGRGCRSLRRALPVLGDRADRRGRGGARPDVTGGEQDCFLASGAHAELRAVDVAQPDVCYLGGITGRWRSPRWRRGPPAGGAPLGEPGLVTVFACTSWRDPERRALCRVSIEGPELLPLAARPFRSRPGRRGRDGQVPTGPGWGVEIRPGWLARAERRVSAL